MKHNNTGVPRPSVHLPLRPLSCTVYYKLSHLVLIVCIRLNEMVAGSCITMDDLGFFVALLVPILLRKYMFAVILCRLLIGSELNKIVVIIYVYHLGPRVYPMGSIVITLVRPLVHLSVSPSLNISEDISKDSFEIVHEVQAL